MALTMFQGKSSRKLPLRADSALPVKRRRPPMSDPEATPLHEKTYIDALRDALQHAPHTGSAAGCYYLAPLPEEATGRAQRVKDALAQHTLSEQHPTTPPHPTRAVQRSLHAAFSISTLSQEQRTPVDDESTLDWLNTLLQ